MNRDQMLLVGASALSTTIGVVAGVVAANKRLEKKYVAIAEQEIEDAKNFYANKERYPNIADAVVALVPPEEQEIVTKKQVELFADNDNLKAVPKTHTDYAGAYENPGERKVTVETKEEEGVVVETTTVETPETEIVVEEVKLESKNVFLEGRPIVADEWDLDEEMEERRRGNPYVIDVDTYNRNETDFDQITFTYFRQDDTVVDERDMVLERVRETLGDRFTTQFGFGSGNAKAVYIRNEKDNADYEVILHEGSYAEMKGFVDDEPGELRHSDMRRGRREWDG